MLSNLVAGAQYCSQTHCEYQELQLEPSAFHAVRTYTCTDAEAGGDAAAASALAMESPPFNNPPPLSALFGVNVFGLATTAMHGDLGVEPDEQQEAVGEEGDAALAELDPGGGDEVPSQAADMA
jgi:hypothetical protein